MTRGFIASLVTVGVLLAIAAPAPAAWTKPGACRIPAGQEFDQLDRANNRFSTKKVPCYIAAFAIDALLRDGRWSRTSFNYTARGARWYVKLSCASRLGPKSDDPQRGRVVTCQVRDGTDAETKRGSSRDLARGSIDWQTMFTG